MRVRWQVSNGQKFRIGEDRWLPTPSTYKSSEFHGFSWWRTCVDILPTKTYLLKHRVFPDRRCEMGGKGGDTALRDSAMEDSKASLEWLWATLNKACPGSFLLHGIAWCDYEINVVVLLVLVYWNTGCYSTMDGTSLTMKFISSQGWAWLGWVLLSCMTLTDKELRTWCCGRGMGNT